MSLLTNIVSNAMKGGGKKDVNFYEARFVAIIPDHVFEDLHKGSLIEGDDFASSVKRIRAAMKLAGQVDELNYYFSSYIEKNLKRIEDIVYGRERDPQLQYLGDARRETAAASGI